MALFRLAGFELRQQLRRVSTWVYFTAFAAIGFLLIGMLTGMWSSIDMGDPILRANSPASIANNLLAMSILGIPITAALAGNAVYRDFQTGSYPLFFTTPISRGAYLGGRLLGAVSANLVIFLGMPLGMWLATVSPWADAGRIAPFDLSAYLRPMLVLVVPNLLFTSAVFLTLAALTRRMLPNYVGGMVLLLGWAVAQVFISAVDDDRAVWLADPFGSAALDRMMRYWTVVEQNTRALPVPPLLWANRALWLGVGAVVFATGVAAFRFAHAGGGGEGRRRAGDEPVPMALQPPIVVPHAWRDFGFGARLRQLAAETLRSLRQVVFNLWFPMIVGICLLFVLVNATQVGAIYGTETYPVTYKVLELLSGTFALFLVIIIAFYAGELVWNERELKAAQIHDALPVPTWVPLLAKSIALAAVVVALLVAAMLCGMLIQAAHGYLKFEPGQYLTSLFVLDLLGHYLPLVVLAVLIQTLVNHKYVGHFLFILYFVGAGLLSLVGLEHNLTVYTATPTPQYSDMNGYGHPFTAWGWFALYWGLVAVLLAIASNLFWVRGEEGGARWRLRLARLRLTRPLLAVAGGTLALVLATGGFIFYNTNVLNDFTTRRAGERVQAEYERLYKRFEWAPQPRVTAATLAVDIRPESRGVRARGEYRLVNRSGVRVDSLHVDVNNTLAVHRLEVDRPAARVIGDSARGYYVFRLAAPLAPGDSMRLRFDLEDAPRGFENEPGYGAVLGNGSFIHSDGILPGIGYNPSGELVDQGARDRYGLAYRPRAASIHDPRARMRNFVSRDADWMDFDVTLSTSPDQVAVAPGYLVRAWKAGGRRYFRYRMDAPILNFYAFLSARYVVKRDRWRNVAIEVYHHRGHEYNVDRMIGAVKASVDYYTREFGPYQHRQVRILEFPRYGEFAQSFDNTIPYSEAIGFIADVKADDIDYPFFVTAHEVAHQWWGHQVAGADVQGAAMLSETLAEYSALMVMEKKFGRAHIGRFLRHELDGYLRGRGTERRAEKPLVLVESQQYIHYNKGGLAMYALRDLLGEETVNGALRSFLRETRFRGPPYPTSLDLLRAIQAAAPDSMHGAVSDLLEHVTLYETAAQSATYRELDDDRYEVTLRLTAKKIRADSLGNETPRPMDDLVDVGVYAYGEDAPGFLRRFRIRGDTTLRVVVDDFPARAGIDPLHKLIDRRQDDNVVDVTAAPVRAPARPRGGAAPARPRGIAEPADTGG